MKILRVDHIALCVPEIEPALAQWQGVLGLLLGAREYVPAQLTDTAFLFAPGQAQAQTQTAGATGTGTATIATLWGAEAEACVELIAPTPRGQNAGLEKFLEKRGGLHHIAFAVDDLPRALDEMFERGVPLIDRTPRPGARGHHVAFLHPKALSGVLVELISS